MFHEISLKLPSELLSVIHSKDSPRNSFKVFPRIPSGSFRYSFRDSLWDYLGDFSWILPGIDVCHDSSIYSSLILSRDFFQFLQGFVLRFLQGLLQGLLQDSVRNCFWDSFSNYSTFLRWIALGIHPRTLVGFLFNYFTVSPGIPSGNRPGFLLKFLSRLLVWESCPNMANSIQHCGPKFYITKLQDGGCSKEF